MKRKKVVIGSSIAIISMITSGLIASAAWFAPKENTFKANVSGSVVEEYFHCGNGTEANPFVITRPIHYYHLVEFFQRKTVLPVTGGTVTFGTDYLYFQIGYDLDDNSSNGLEVYTYDNYGAYQNTTGKVLNMAYYAGNNALMPIGTSECPFFGSFDGGANESSVKSVVVSNLNIKSSEQVVVHGGSTPITRSTADVGMFGYVADDDNPDPEAASVNPTVIKNLSVNGLTIDLTGASANKNPASGVPHEDSASHDGKVFVGYIAGHIHTYKNYKAAGPVNASPLYNVYVNNAKIVGGVNNATCGFGYVGYADYIDGKAGTEYDLLTQIDALEAAAGDGQGSDWGGSIDMLSLNKRIRYFLNKNLTALTGGSSSNPAAIVKNKGIKTKARRSSYQYRYRYYTDDYGSYSTFQGGSGETYYDKDPSTNAIIYRFVGGGSSVLGLDTASGSYLSTAYFTIPESYVPLLTESEENGYAVSENNTGYIVGDLVAAQNTVRTASYANSFIQNSYVSSELEVLSNSTVSYSASNYRRINNGNTHTSTALSGYAASIEPSSMYGYSSAYEKICGVLSSSSFVQGLHFTGNIISSSNISTVPSAWIDGNNYTNYKVLRSSVNFNAKKNGSIKFFAGSYYNSVGTNSDSFFSLHTVSRSGSTVTPAQIYSIYANTNATTKKDYPHLYYDSNNNLIAAGYGNTVTKGSLEFDMNWLHNAPPVANAVYYFEIPVNKGEFALGSVAADKTKGAYLMYLDIGTSGGGTDSTYDTAHKIAEEPIFTQIEYLSSGYVINACFNIGFAIPSGATKNNFYVMVNRNGDVFEVDVVNTTGNDLSLYILLVDNDEYNYNNYPYTYKLTLNGGTTQEYDYSAKWRGASGGNTFNRITT